MISLVVYKVNQRTQFDTYDLSPQSFIGFYFNVSIYTRRKRNQGKRDTRTKSSRSNSQAKTEESGLTDRVRNPVRTDRRYLDQHITVYNTFLFLTSVQCRKCSGGVYRGGTGVERSYRRGVRE